MTKYQIKRVYEEASSDDGYRVLVDSLWPRGVSRDQAQLDAWRKDIAPSPELRKWFKHDPQRFIEFSARYQSELRENPAVSTLKHAASEHPVVTLLYGARGPCH